MKIRLSLPLALAAFLAAPILTLAALTKLSPGKYTAALSPTVDEQTADLIESQLKNIEGLSKVDVRPEDSSLHFTVKKDASVEFAQIQDEVKAVAADTMVNEPIAEGAMSGSKSETKPKAY